MVVRSLPNVKCNISKLVLHPSSPLVCFDGGWTKRPASGLQWDCTPFKIVWGIEVPWIIGTKFGHYNLSFHPLDGLKYIKKTQFLLRA